MTTTFVNNKEYSPQSYYSHPYLVEVVKQSSVFQRYVKEISGKIKEEFVFNNQKINSK